MISRHINAVFIVLCNIFKNTSIIRLGDLTISVMRNVLDLPSIAGPLTQPPTHAIPSIKSSGSLPTFRSISAFLHSSAPLQVFTFRSTSLLASLNVSRTAAVTPPDTEYCLPNLLPCCRVSVHSSGSIFFASNMLANSS